MSPIKKSPECNEPNSPSSYREVGPLSQSLFLGCSVTNFNMNLAWGEDSSTLTVTLVEDKAYHPRSIRYNQLNTIATQLNIPPNITDKSHALEIKQDETFAIDRSKNLLKSISLEIEQQHNDNDNVDLGKICKDVNGRPTYWLGPDPGFLAGANKFSQAGYDLIGVPAVFWFQDLYFGGLITSWKAMGSQGGSPTYEIEMKSGASLLKGCQLIIDEYAGTVASLIGDISVPSHYNINFPFLPHNTTIEQGNLPNVFNIYGYWEYGGYGNSGRTDNGIPALNIYNALVNMLAPGTNDTDPFFPHGAILGRTLSFATDGTPADVDASGIDDADRNHITLKNCGLCPGVVGEDGIFHAYYKLDLSALADLIPPNLYITGPTISLMSFITEVCDGAGFDFFISLEPALPGSNCTGYFRVNTISRRLQPQKDVIKNYVSSLVNQNLNVSTFNYGQEYADQTTRSMYLGGKQKRLLQFKSSSLTSNQTTLVYDPYANNRQGSFISYANLGQPGSNQARFPSFLSTRRYTRMQNGGAAVAENPPGDFNDTTTFSDGPNPIDPWSNSNSFRRGNYDTGHSIATQINLVSLPLRNHPLYSDMICPYFGVGSNGLARKVYFDPGMAQMQILFYIDDLKGSLPRQYYDGYTNYSASFIVLENEIRAAGKGFDEWMTYVFNDLFTTDIAELCYKAFRQTYGNFGSYVVFDGLIKAVRSFSMGETQLRRAQIQGGRPRGAQVSLEQISPYAPTLLHHLKAIHQFFANIATEYYGKQYMIKIPMPRYYRDRSLFTNDGDTVSIGDGLYAQAGTGKIYSEFEISSDGAWEEPGNYIDDALVVGSATVNAMCDDQGKIPPMVAFSSHPEINTREKWVAEQYVANASNIGNTVSGPTYLVTDWALLMNGRNSTNATNEDNNYYNSINHSLPAEEYIDIYAGGFPNVAAYRTAHGRPIGGGNASRQVYKTYVKSNCEKDFVFLSVAPDGSLADPRVVMQISSPVKLGNGRNWADKDLGRILAQDFLCKMVRGSSIPTPVQGLTGGETVNGGLRRFPNTLFWDPRLFMTMFWWPDFQREIFWDNNGQTANDSQNNMQMLEKAAVPYFAAIPIESPLATYGPWTNHPGLIAGNIFLGGTDPSASVNNLAGSVKVQHDAGLVPWNYGGMDSLDAAVMAKIKDDVNYQQITEQGSIQVPGAILTTLEGTAFNLGNALIGENTGFGGPIVSSIQVQVGEGGITTNYNFRTYTRKLGFYNKENADRIKAIGQESLKRRKEISTSLLKVLSTLNNGPQYGSTVNNHPMNIWDATRNQDNTPKVLRWSPFEILVGANSTIVHPNSTITDIYKDLNYSPGWSKLPFTTRTNIPYDTINMIRESTNVSLQDVHELPREFKNGYANKSMMSLDGILSPISFYPTANGSTFSITKYPRPGCPFCKGTAFYSYKYLDPDNPLTNATISEITNAVAQKQVDCPFCETIEDKKKKALISVSPKETNPPYILASGHDLTLIGKNNLAAPNGLSGNPIINYGTLNPILMSMGEFSNSVNKQLDDITGHSIDLIGQGQSVPERGNGLKPAYSTNIDRSFSDYDINYMEFCSSRGMAPGTLLANNMRYFGLRGPLMVHAWGYDLEGYPVPNASGEPKVVDGEIVRDQNTREIIYKNQTQNIDGTWTEPYKEHQFYKGWGQLPSTWPVGPIDLRWDANAGVWTVGANYKPVWIVLETDLVNRQPSRGAIIEDSYTNDPLPSGLRKLVFVQDNLGIMPVPRNAPVYCKYNGQNGFYEPIYNKSYVTSGIIAGDTQVSIYNIYENPNNTATNLTTPGSPTTIPSPTTYLTTYKNPMGFSISNGELGMFMFMDGSWTLQSVNC